MSRSNQESYARNQAYNAAIEKRKARIRALNDGFRRSFVGGRVVITAGVQVLPLPTLTQVLLDVRAFDAFSPDNDPYEEHDFGSIEASGQRLFWKIDCYDKQLQFGSPDPADPDVTARVLTIMFASEY